MMQFRFLLAGALIALLSTTAMAQSRGGVALMREFRTMNEVVGRLEPQMVSAQIAAHFDGSFGSPDNAWSLVHGLRTGQDISLSSVGADGKRAALTFTPPTGTMSFANVFLTLSIADKGFRENGITNPSATQIQAMLMGGEISVGSKKEQLPGILARRLTGEGWGIIAAKLGVDLEPIVGEMRAETNKFLAANESSGVPSAPAQVQRR